MAEVQGVSGSPVVQRRLKNARDAEAERQAQDNTASNDAVRAERKQKAENDNTLRVQRQRDEQAVQNQQQEAQSQTQTTQSQQKTAVDLTRPPHVSPALQVAKRAARSQQQGERARNVKAEQNQPVAEKEIGGTVNVTT